jgi:hypothetical protein
MSMNAAAGAKTYQHWDYNQLSRGLVGCLSVHCESHGEREPGESLLAGIPC